MQIETDSNNLSRKCDTVERKGYSGVDGPIAKHDDEQNGRPGESVRSLEK
jgi:hypothetical protein